MRKEEEMKEWEDEKRESALPSQGLDDFCKDCSPNHDGHSPNTQIQ